jgi:hypothetical protein
MFAIMRLVFFLIITPTVIVTVYISTLSDRRVTPSTSLPTQV